MMTAEEKLARLTQIERRKEELEKEYADLAKERRDILGGRDTRRRAPSKSLSPSQIDAAFAGLMRGLK